MSQAISIANKPQKSPDVIWRVDGEDNQIILASKEGLALPLMLNPTAAKIFLLCDGSNTLEDIAASLCAEFSLKDFDMVLGDVKKQVSYFADKGIVEI
jgi:hypothetical protein